MITAYCTLRSDKENCFMPNLKECGSNVANIRLKTQMRIPMYWCLCSVIYRVTILSKKACEYGCHWIDGILDATPRLSQMTVCHQNCDCRGQRLLMPGHVLCFDDIARAWVKSYVRDLHRSMRGGSNFLTDERSETKVSKRLNKIRRYCSLWLRSPRRAYATSTITDNSLAHVLWVPKLRLTPRRYLQINHSCLLTILEESNNREIITQRWRKYVDSVLLWAQDLRPWFLAPFWAKQTLILRPINVTKPLFEARKTSQGLWSSGFLP